MTLAEVFLLLLIVGWYGSRLESEAAGYSTPRPAAVVEKELIEAKSALARSEAENRRLQLQVREFEALLEHLASLVKARGPLDTQQAITDAVKKFGADARRGKPGCRVSNILLSAVVADGQMSATLHQTVQGYAAESVLSGRRLERLLADVSAFYRERRSDGSECVFDYNLRWRTDADYRMGRQHFERYFYLARERRVE